LQNDTIKKKELIWFFAHVARFEVIGLMLAYACMYD